MRISARSFRSQSLGRKDAEVLKKIFPNTEITLYYGASELNYITYVKSADMTEERNLIGKPFPGVRVFIQDDEMYVDNAFHVENITVPYSLKDSGRMDLQGISISLDGRMISLACVDARCR